MTTELFREDSYLKNCEAEITGLHETGFSCDQTVFYATGGGQPGDTGIAVTGSGSEIIISNTVRDRESGTHIHCAEDLNGLTVGDRITLKIDWDRRYRLMRMHSCLHMLCAAIPAPVTGGSVQDGRGRLDFDLPENIDREATTAKLNELISGNHVMSTRWITDAELDANPELVRTLSAPPPRGTGRVRLVEFKDTDLQPCGGTHVASTGEIGQVRIQKVEKKGKMNRRITVVFEE